MASQRQERAMDYLRDRRFVFAQPIRSDNRLIGGHLVGTNDHSVFDVPWKGVLPQSSVNPHLMSVPGAIRDRSWWGRDWTWLPDPVAIKLPPTGPDCHECGRQDQALPLFEGENEFGVSVLQEALIVLPPGKVRVGWVKETFGRGGKMRGGDLVTFVHARYPRFRSAAMSRAPSLPALLGKRPR